MNEGIKKKNFQEGNKKAATLCKERRVRKDMTKAYKPKMSVGKVSAVLLFLKYHSTRSREPSRRSI